MKKRTKKKLIKFSGKLLRETFKLIFIYPPKAIWFVSKQFYYAVKDSRNRKKSPKSVSNFQTKESTKQNKTEENFKTFSKPLLGKIKIEPAYDNLKEIRPLQGNFEQFSNKLFSTKSTIGLILGARGTGKSAIGMRLLENFKSSTDKNIYALGFKPDSLPHWIKVVEGVETIENNSVILVDEGGIEFSSRKSMSDANTFLSEILLIARHKDLSVIFITQNSSNLEVNVIRQADYLVMKPSSLLQKDFERKKIKEIYSSVADHFDELKEEIGLTYIYAGNYRGFISNSLPTFWSEGVSKGYSKH